jgi:hypothetical protein
MEKISPIMLMKITRWKFKMKMSKFRNKFQSRLKHRTKKLALKITRAKEISKTLKTSLEIKGEPKMQKEEIINVAFVQRHILVIPHYILT